MAFLRSGGFALDSVDSGACMNAGAGTASRSGAASACVVPPACNTGGTETQAAVCIDWLRVTFEMSEAGVPHVVKHFALATGLSVEAVESKGLHAFTRGLQLRAVVGLSVANVARLSWGGASQRGRAELDIPGGGCGCIEDWHAVVCWLRTLPCVRITRCDVAADLMSGEYSVDDAVEWYRGGQFSLTNRAPKIRQAGDWIGPGDEGRTFYVGKAANGKMLRVYEKGKQLSNPESRWTRFEVQFGNRDRELPFEILTEPERFFVGAYPALERILGVAAQLIPTITTTAELSLVRIFAHIRRSYGKWFHTFADSRIDPTDLLAAIRIREVPGRIQASAVVAGLLADSTETAFNRWKETLL